RSSSATRSSSRRARERARRSSRCRSRVSSVRPSSASTAPTASAHSSRRPLGAHVVARRGRAWPRTAGPLRRLRRSATRCRPIVTPYARRPEHGRRGRTGDRSFPMTAASMTVLQAQSRVAAGKSEARRLRKSGLVPAVAYGKGLPSTPIAVPPKEVAAVLRSELGKNTVLELALDGKKLVAMIRDFTLHPVKRNLEHVDFVEVKLDQPVD